MADIQNSQNQWLVEKYNKIPEMLKGFFDNILDLVCFLESEGYIKESTMTKWKEGIKQALSYLESHDLMTAFSEIYIVAKGMQRILDRIIMNAYWNDQPIPDPLRKKFSEIAESSREFLSVLLDMIDYYADTYRSPPIIQASWSEKVNNAYFLLEHGDLEPAIGDILVVIGDLRPLLDELRNQIENGQYIYNSNS